MQSSLAATVADNFIFIFTFSVFCLFGDLWKWEYREKHEWVKYKPKRHAQDKTTFSIIKLFHFNISSTVKKKKSLFKTQWLNLPQGYSKLDSNKLYYFEFLKWSKPLNTKKKALCCRLILIKIHQAWKALFHSLPSLQAGTGKQV